MNNLPADSLEAAWQAAGKWLLKRMTALRGKPILLNPEGGISSVVHQILRSRTLGVSQQALCFASTRILYEGLGPEYFVRSKRTWAGDAQSGVHGDIHVGVGEDLRLVLEVKAHVVDRVKLAETLIPHGVHRYCLTIIAQDFEPDLKEREGLLFVRMPDYVTTVLAQAAASRGISTEAVGGLVLKAYNRYVKNVEDRPELMIVLGN